MLSLAPRSTSLTLWDRATALTLAPRTVSLTLEDGGYMTSRQVLETDIRQGLDESISYTLTTTPWGSSPTSISVTAWDITYGEMTNVSSTVLTGTPAAVGDVITLPVMAGLTENHAYRVEVKFTSGGHIFEPYFIVFAER